MYTIRIESDHPLADQSVANGAQVIAEELEQDPTHPFKVIVMNEAGQPITTWEGN